jgi:pantetheine-phosphate adenylyltransferase
MKKIAVFPGSFDPITKGHLDIIERAVPIFDELIIGIGINTEKKNLFPLAQRKAWIEQVTSNFNNVKVADYQGLTVDFCKSVDAKYIIRGLRNAGDFEFERSIAQMNADLANNIETIFMVARPELSHIASTLVRDVIRNGGDVKAFLPKGIMVDIR